MEDGSEKPFHVKGNSMNRTNEVICTPLHPSNLDQLKVNEKKELGRSNRNAKF